MLRLPIDDSVYVPRGERPPTGYSVVVGHDYGGHHVRWARPDPETGLLMVGRRGTLTCVCGCRRKLPLGYEEIRRDELLGVNGSALLAPTDTAHLWTAAVWILYVARWKVQRVGVWILRFGAWLAQVDLGRLPWSETLAGAFVAAYHLCEERDERRRPTTSKPAELPEEIEIDPQPSGQNRKNPPRYRA